MYQFTQLRTGWELLRHSKGVEILVYEFLYFQSDDVRIDTVVRRPDRWSFIRILSVEGRSVPGWPEGTVVMICVVKLSPMMGLTVWETDFGGIAS